MHQIQSFAHRIIRQKARQLVGKYGFSRSDREDLEQELWLDLIRRWKRAGDRINDPQAFVVTVVNRQVANLIEQRQTKKHSNEDLRSLDTLVPDEDGRLVPFAEVIPSEQSQARRQTSKLDEFEHCHLKLDMAEILDQLSPSLRELCLQLQKHSVADAAREMNVPRSSVRSAVRCIRDRFGRAGVDGPRKNLEPFRPDFRSEELIEDQLFQQHLERAVRATEIAELKETA